MATHVLFVLLIVAPSDGMELSLMSRAKIRLPLAHQTTCFFPVPDILKMERETFQSSAPRSLPASSSWTEPLITSRKMQTKNAS